MSAAIDTVQVGTGYLPTVRDGDELRVVLKPAVEAIGLSYGSVWNRLKRRSWATIFMTEIVAGDGKVLRGFLANTLFSQVTVGTHSVST